jgi:nucleoid-associated protein YgaU
MAREVVTIFPAGQPTIRAQFNPNNYSLAKSNQIAEAAVPGLDAPILQYVHGNVRTLDMELFFDSYEKGTPVFDATQPIYNLLLIDPGTHAPPICDIFWGTLSLQAVLDHVTTKFTLFLPDGTPVRATVTVTFKEYLDVDELVQVKPTRSADHRTMRVVRSGDRIDNIAAEEYGDPEKWRPITEANRLNDPFSLEAGHILIVPALL